MTPRQERRLWELVRAIENFWESLPEIEPGMVARLNALASGRGWEVIFLTKRPATKGVTAQLQTQRWLEAHGFALPSVYVVQGSRGAIAAALGLISSSMTAPKLPRRRNRPEGARHSRLPQRES
jgi:hypothetical protein